MDEIKFESLFISSASELKNFLENLWLLLVRRFMDALIRKLLTTSRHINSILVFEHKWKILTQFTTHKVVAERSLFGHLLNRKFFSLPDFADTKNTLHFMVNFKSMDFYVQRDWRLKFDKRDIKEAVKNEATQKKSLLKCHTCNKNHATAACAVEASKCDKWTSLSV